MKSFSQKWFSQHSRRMHSRPAGGGLMQEGWWGGSAMLCKSSRSKTKSKERIKNSFRGELKELKDMELLFEGSYCISPRKDKVIPALQNTWRPTGRKEVVTDECLIIFSIGCIIRYYVCKLKPTNACLICQPTNTTQHSYWNSYCLLMSQISWGVLRIYNKTELKSTGNQSKTPPALQLRPHPPRVPNVAIFHLLHLMWQSSTPGMQEDVLTVTADHSHRIRMEMLWI